MLNAIIIYPVDQSEWAIPMEVHPNKHDPKKLHVCVEFKGLNKVTLTGPFPTPFVDEITNEVCYSLNNGFSGYNLVPIAKED